MAHEAFIVVTETFLDGLHRNSQPMVKAFCEKKNEINETQKNGTSYRSRSFTNR